jgi:hypothetical protein
VTKSMVGGDDTWLEAWIYSKGKAGVTQGRVMKPAGKQTACRIIDGD